MSVKPINLNQLLFHPRVTSLSFFRPFKGADNIDSFLEEVLKELQDQDSAALVQLLEKYRAQIKKIIASHPLKSHGFFISEELQGYVVLEQSVESYFTVGPNFHVRPLLEELFVNPEFMLVNVSLYDIKVYKGDFQHLEIIQHYEFDQLPKNFSEDFSRVYTPQYMGLIPYKTILALKTIAQKLKDLTLYESLPVIVTGLEEMKNIFLDFFHDTAGIITQVNEDFYEKTCMEILEKCRNFRYLVTEYYSLQLKERLKRMMKSRRILTDLTEIIKAVYAGKVIHLVIPTEQKIWGKFDPATGEFVIHKKIGKTSLDIVNELAEEVIRQGGKINILGKHFFPHNAEVLATIRGSL